LFVSKLRIKNWRNFTKSEFSLDETVFVVGPNASGKSNLLDIFRFMRDIVNPKGGGLQQAVASRGGFSKVRSLAARRPPEIELDFELRERLDDPSDDPDWRYVLAIQSEVRGDRRPIVLRERVYHAGTLLRERPDAQDKKDAERLIQTHLEQINMNLEFRAISAFFEDVLYLHLVPQLLKFGDMVALRQLESDPFGQGFLEQLAVTAPAIRKSRLNRIEAILKKVISNLTELKFVKDDATGRPHLEMRYEHWRPKAAVQREDQFSDGTLRLIAMLWTLLSSNNMILLEEPELSLHEKIVAHIPDLIYRARQSRKKAGGQIIISTHSRAMLSGKSIAGGYLILKPGTGGEATSISTPTDSDEVAMRNGLSPAEVLLPQTSASIQDI
jgi:ABC-type lipoprotein export system ATPase subunit